MDIDLAQADALLTTTRGVRRRLDFARPVGRQVIEDCVRVALQAPVGSRNEKQHFVVVMDADKRHRIADVYRKTCYPYLEEREAVAASLDPGDPDAELIRGNLALAKWQADTLHQAPCLVIAAKEGRVEDSPAFTQASFYGSILPAAWSFHACPAGARSGVLLDHLAHRLRARGGAGSGDARGRNSRGAAHGWLLHRKNFQTGRPGGTQGADSLGPVGRARVIYQRSRS